MYLDVRLDQMRFNVLAIGQIVFFSTKQRRLSRRFNSSLQVPCYQTLPYDIGRYVDKPPFYWLPG